MKLDVKANGELAGWISLDSGSGLFAFDYAPDWLAKDIRFPLSPALPLEARAIPPEQHSAAVRQFFQNLLPEGQALDDAAQANKVSKSNLMGLLIALGQETAGALSLSLADPCHPPTGKPQNACLAGMNCPPVSARARKRRSRCGTAKSGCRLPGTRTRLRFWKKTGTGIWSMAKALLPPISSNPNRSVPACKHDQ